MIPVVAPAVAPAVTNLFESADDFKAIAVSHMEEKAFMKQFSTKLSEKSFSVSQRESKMFNTRSRLYGKRIAAQTLRGNVNAAKDYVLSAKRKLSLETRLALGEQNTDILSVFLTGTWLDNMLIEQFTNKDTRFKAFDRMLEKLMGTSFEIRALTDDEFSQYAGELEEISRKVYACRDFLKANPEYANRLSKKFPGSDMTEMEKVNERLDKMLALSDYYRARKALITDSYYINHYNEELCTDKSKVKTDDQRRIAGLINLVAQCTRRMTGEETSTREEAGIEKTLLQAETRSRQCAYLTGQPDLSKIDTAKAHKNNKEIAEYFRRAGLGAMVRNDEILRRDKDNPYPEAQKYKTQAVTDYYDAIWTKITMAEGPARDIVPPERMELFETLRRKSYDKNNQSITTPEFKDPKTGEVFKLNTNIQRMAKKFCILYGTGMSNEEIIDVFDGLLLTYHENIDLNKEDQRLYARERFLDSLQKIFRMEYDCLKKYENTYGTLADDLPLGVFVQTLGSGQKDMIIRNQLGQDLAELCDEASQEKNCISDGEKMTTAQLLVKYGKISREEVDDALNLGPDYYQTVHAGINPHYNGLADFDPEYVGVENNTFGALNDFYIQQHTKDNVKIGGPKMDETKVREIWQNSLDYSEDLNLTGSPIYVAFQKDKLDLYSSAEKKEIKKSRKKDADIRKLYKTYLDNRQKSLFKKTKERLRIHDYTAESDLLELLIVFHPGMLKTDTLAGEDQENDGFEVLDERDVEGTDRYLEIVKKFIGIGVDEGNFKKAKKEATGELIGLWSKLIGSSTVDSIETLMNGFGANDPDEIALQARENPQRIMEGSVLLKSEVRSRMFDSIRNLTSNGKMELSNEILTEQRANFKGQIQQEIYRNLMNSSFYLELKDIGSKRSSESEKMYQDLMNYLYGVLSHSQTDVRELLNDKRFTNTLWHFGIKTDGLFNFFAPEEKSDKKIAVKPVYRTEYNRHIAMSESIRNLPSDGNDTINEIKELMNKLTESLNKEMKDDSDSFRGQMASAALKYDQLILLCMSYEHQLSDKKLSYNDQERLRMINDLKAQLTDERIHYADIGTAMNIYSDRTKGMVLGNLLGGKTEDLGILDMQRGYEECTDELSGYKHMLVTDEQTFHGYDFYFEKEPGLLPEEFKKNVSVTRLMDFLGVGNLNRRSELTGSNDAEGKWHHGMRTARLYNPDENITASELLRKVEQERDAGAECSIEYTQAALKHLSIIQMMRMLAGASNPNDYSNIMYMTLEKEVDGKKIYTVTGAYMDLDTNLFTELTGKALEKGANGRPAINIDELPFVDQQFAEAVMAMHPEDFNVLTSGLMTDKQQKAFASRLEWLQKKLDAKMKNDRNKPENERDFIRPGEYEDPQTATKLKTKLEESDVLFTGLMGQDVKIEGIPAQAGSQEEIYRRVYHTVRSKLISAKGPKEVFKILSLMTLGANNQALEIQGLDEETAYQMMDELQQRLAKEFISKEMLRCALTERFEANKSLVAAYDEKAKKITKVPDEFRDPEGIREAIEGRMKVVREDATEKNEPLTKEQEEEALKKVTARVEEKVKEQYIIYLLHKENPMLFMEHDRAALVSTKNFGLTYGNMTLDVKNASAILTLRLLEKEIRNSPEYKKYDADFEKISDRGESYKETAGKYNLLNKAKAKEVIDVQRQAAKQAGQEVIREVLGNK